jgi:hypothetical protein
MIAEPPTVDPPLIEPPEAGVIEDARARRRRQRQAGAAATLIAAAIAAIALASSGGGGRDGVVPPIVARVASRLPGLNLAHARLALTDAPAEYQLWILPGGNSPGDETCLAAVSLDPAVTRGSSAWCARAGQVRYWGMQYPIYRNNPGGGVTVVGLEPGTAANVTLVSDNGARRSQFPVTNHAYLVTNAAAGDKITSTTVTGTRVTHVIARATPLPPLGRS